MDDLPDAESLRKMREVADAIPPQSSPACRKALADFKAALKRLEKARRWNDRSSR